ncbi:MAG: DUF3575 domain-containing protein [Bacteroidota bacterium]
MIQRRQDTLRKMQEAKNRKNIISFDASWLLLLPAIAYQHHFNNRKAIKTGVQYSYIASNASILFPSIWSGYSILVTPEYRCYLKAQEYKMCGAYLAPYARLRYEQQVAKIYSGPDEYGHVKTWSAGGGMVFGYQYSWQGKCFLDAFAGPGFMIDNSTSDNNDKIDKADRRSGFRPAGRLGIQFAFCF